MITPARYGRRLALMRVLIDEEMPDSLIRAQALLVIEASCGSPRRAIRWIAAHYLASGVRCVRERWHAGLVWLGIEVEL